MFPLPQRITPCRFLILGWAILWVITVPLFHTHLPDLSDGPSARSGLAHTVFSQDLPGEFSSFSGTAHRDHFAQLSNPISNSPELDFVLSSEDSKSRKTGDPNVLGVLFSLPRASFSYTMALQAGSTQHRPLLVAAQQSPRGPPVVVS
jgi:hypothetical protein